MKPKRRTTQVSVVSESQSAEIRKYLSIRYIDNYIGHGVFTEKAVKEKELLCFYHGELITREEGERRLRMDSDGNFLFFFTYKNQQLCIDGSHASGCGRMINDSHKKPNCKVQVIDDEGKPRLAIFSLKHIGENTELRFDYGDKTVHWRKKNDERKAYFREPEFLNETPEVVVISRSGDEETGRFPLTNAKCLIGSSRDCDIVVSMPGVKSVHCQLEFNKGQVLFTDFHSERILGCGEEFNVLERRFRIKKRKGPDDIQGEQGTEYLQDEQGTDDVHGEQRTEYMQGEQGTDDVLGEQGTEYMQCEQGTDDVHGEQRTEYIQCEQGTDDVHGEHRPEDMQGEQRIDDVPGEQGTGDVPGELVTDDAQGEQGTDNIQGELGTDDVHGELGTDDIQGEQGTEYMQDEQGIDYVHGEQRPEDMQGEQGTEDVPGEQGIDDVPGELGTEDVPGELVTDDAQGEQGTDNIQGELGTDDVHGELGIEDVQGEIVTDEVHGEQRTKDRQGEPCTLGTEDVQGELGTNDVQNEQGTDDEQNTDQIENSDDSETDESSDTVILESSDSYKPETSDSEDDEFSEAGEKPEEIVLDSDSDMSETSNMYPELNKTIDFQECKENSRGNLNNKKHACFFCEKLFPNIARHITNKHASEHEVAKILIIPKKSKLRRIAWQKLVNKGDFTHNYKVFEENSGTVIPRYRSRKKQQRFNSVFCYGCKALYKKKDLWKHKRTCKSEAESLKFRPVHAGKLMMPSTKGASTCLQENVLARMIDDEIKMAVQTDDMILRYGNSLCEEKGNILHQHTYISNKLRTLGRLLISAKKMNTSVRSLYDILKNTSWDIFIASVKSVAGYNDENYHFEIPSLAKKLGDRMQTCAELEYFRALKEEDQERLKVCETFLNLYRLGWRKAISAKAHSSIQENKYNKPLLLPLVGDVVTFNKILKLKGAELCTKIEKKTCEHYSELAKVTLAQIILFNRKRSGEAQRMTIKNFIDAKKGGEVDETVLNTLTEFEKSLCRSHLRVEIKGKKGRRVPVLLTEDLTHQLNILLRYRQVAKVKETTFMFARPGNAEFPFRGHDCLREFATHCGLKKPECITSTKLRKQLAVLAQILNLKENSQDIIAAFQGHDIRIHREYYRLPESTLQIAKVSKLLHSVNEGTIHRFKGMDLDTMDLYNTDTVEDESASETDTDTDEDEGEDSSTNGLLTGNKHKVLEVKGRDETEPVVSIAGPKHRIPLAVSERKIIETEFKSHIKREKVPGKLDVTNFCQKNPNFAKYPWTKIKFAVHNMITARKRKSKTII